MNDSNYIGAVRQIGDILRDWRQRRRLTRQELADAAGTSVGALAATETGRELPSREAVLRLSEPLDIPLRDRNALLAAAGHEPAFPHQPTTSPEGAAIVHLIEGAVAAHAPIPALALDRHWTVVTRNAALGALIVGVDPALLQPPVNWARVMLHPAGLAPRIANLRDWHACLSSRLRRQFDLTGDTKLADLLEEIADYPIPPAPDPEPARAWASVPLRLVTVDGLLCFHAAMTQFPSAVDVTLSEVTIEAFYPADDTTAAAMRARPAAGD
jgi:transcriptional regulator with XRE-family HTH domain